MRRPLLFALLALGGLFAVLYPAVRRALGRSVRITLLIWMLLLLGLGAASLFKERPTADRVVGGAGLLLVGWVAFSMARDLYREGA